MDNEKTGQDIRLKKGGRTSTLIAVLLFLVAIAGYTFVTKPLATNYDSAKADVVAQANQIDTLKGRLSFLTASENDLELSSEVEKREIERKIPTEMLQNEVIEDVIEISDDFGINLRSLSFGRGSTGQEGIAALRINASFEGDFTDLTDFLEGIERNGRFMRVNSISVQLNRVEISNITRATFSLSMEAFFREDLT